MVPPASHGISRVPWYSGSPPSSVGFRLRDSYPLRSDFPVLFGYPSSDFCGSSTPAPRKARVWALPRSLAATWEIDVSFSSSGYLDVSVRRVPSSQPMHSAVGDGALPPPGSPIRTSMFQSLLAATHGFSQLATSFFGSWCQGIRPVLFLA